jgi:hypothetical protein
VPEEYTEALDEVFRYDILTQPFFPQEKPGAAAEKLPTVELDSELFFLREGVPFRYGIRWIIADLRADREPALAPRSSPGEPVLPPGLRELCDVHQPRGDRVLHGHAP